MKWKDRLFKFALSVFVVFLFLNPETLQFALFLDVVGLDIFIMLVEVQILAILGAVFSYYVKPIRVYSRMIYRCITQRLSLIKSQEPSQVLALFLPCQATVMHMLVFSAFIGFVFNVQ